MRDAPALARRAVSGHMWSMSGRPCNPGSDLRALWRTLLGNTPMPQCGVPEPQDAEQATVDAADGEQPDELDDGAAARRTR